MSFALYDRVFSLESGKILQISRVDPCMQAEVPEES
jgi:hypothetical protein